MPVNEIEQHPFLDYLGDNPDFSKYNSLIIGSFPIYCITNSTPIEANGEAIRNDWQNDAFMQFFYGSMRNKFWKLFFNAYHRDFENDNPTRIQCIDFVNEKKFILTDVIESSSRNYYRSSDNELIPELFNCNILNIIMKMNGNNIFFTSVNNNNPSPWNWFSINILNRLVDPNGFCIQEIEGTRNLFLTLKLNGQKKIFNVGFLFSPSPFGARNQNRIKEFNNFRQITPDGNYTCFLETQYKELLRNENFNYNGTNPTPLIII